MTERSGKAPQFDPFTGGEDLAGLTPEIPVNYSRYDAHADLIPPYQGARVQGDKQADIPQSRDSGFGLDTHNGSLFDEGSRQDGTKFDEADGSSLDEQNNFTDEKAILSEGHIVDPMQIVGSEDLLGLVQPDFDEAEIWLRENGTHDEGQRPESDSSQHAA